MQAIANQNQIGERLFAVGLSVMAVMPAQDLLQHEKTR